MLGICVLMWVVLHSGSCIHQLGWPPNIAGMCGGPKPFAPNIASLHWPPTFPQTIPPNPVTMPLWGPAWSPGGSLFVVKMHIQIWAHFWAHFWAHVWAHLGGNFGGNFGGLGHLNLWGSFGGKLRKTWQACLLRVDLVVICIYQHLMEPM